mmetsp:Transcript_27310/g.43769  ORF Transcript_27310/g.43769 Transcript_27310/m.43769 type:complete len:213 (-) Transcript_27310:208-846(-)
MQVLILLSSFLFGVSRARAGHGGLHEDQILESLATLLLQKIPISALRRTARSDIAVQEPELLSTKRDCASRHTLADAASTSSGKDIFSTLADCDATTLLKRARQISQDNPKAIPNVKMGGEGVPYDMEKFASELNRNEEWVLLKVRFAGKAVVVKKRRQFNRQLAQALAKKTNSRLLEAGPTIALFYRPKARDQVREDQEAGPALLEQENAE